MAVVKLDRKYIGRVTSFADGIISVKLSDGTIVQCDGTFPSDFVSVNDDVRIIARAGADGRVSFSLSAVNPKVDSQFLARILRMNDGYPGKNTAINMIQFIDEQMKNFNASLDNLNASEEAALKKNKEETAAANKAAEKTYNNDCAWANNEYSENMKATDIGGIAEYVNDSCAALEADLGRLHFTPVSKVASKNSDLIREAALKLWQSNKNLHEAYGKLQASRNEVNGNNFRIRMTQIGDNWTALEKKYRDEYKVLKCKVSHTAEESFYRLLLNSPLTDYYKTATSKRLRASTYADPSSVPEFVVLGDVSCHVGSYPEGRDSFIRLIDSTYPVMKASGRGYDVALPYVQSYKDGISLLIEYKSRDRSYAQSLLQPLLLNMFMSFPAGKLEATMIDPLDLGACFPDILQLGQGANAGRVIDTKIWCKEKDIENAMATFRQRLENIMQAYGDDRESRLSKEVVRALAIADFPVGFNGAALKDLQAIVRNAATLGVCIFICVNVDELNKLRKENGAVVSEILQGLTLTSVNGNKLMIGDFEASKIELHIDMLRDVFADKERIFPIIKSGIEHMQLKIEHFGSLYDSDIRDSRNWFKGRHDEICLPIGIKGANTIVDFVVGRGGGSTEHHALIAGQTGAGKSTLLHTIIMSALVSYSPEELQMYLLDFKEGVEFIDYTKYRIPSLRVIALDSEREFGLNVLRELCNELEKRAKLFTRYGVDNILDYSARGDLPKVPKLLLIFDEVQELFRSREESDKVSSECLSCINKLVMQGRAMGIHLIFACQDFRNCSGLEAYFSQMAIRIAVRGSVDGASSILSADNPGILTLQNQPAGSAIYNGACGVEMANNFFQISFIEKEERLDLLKRIDSYFTDVSVSKRYDEYQPRILLTNAEDNINNCFNQLIMKGKGSLHPLSSTSTGYGLLLGQEFGKKGMFVTEMERRERDNILVVTKNENLALGIFDLSIMSILYDSLQKGKTRTHIYVVDLLDEDENDDCNFDYLEKKFGSRISVVKMDKIETLLSALYDMLQKRVGRPDETDSREFLMFFGVNRAKRICAERFYDGDSEDELTAVEKLQRILTKGPKYGINSVCWGESIRGIESVIGDRYEAMFDKRIAYDLNEEAMETLVSEDDSKSLRGKTSVYMDIGRDIKNTHFRPYEVPSKVWVGKFADAFIRAEEDN